MPIETLESGANSSCMALNQCNYPQNKVSMSTEHLKNFENLQVLMPAEALQSAYTSHAHESCLVIQLKPTKTILQI